MLGKTLLEDFNYRFPWLSRDMKTWKELNSYMLEVELTDGRLFLYYDGNEIAYEIKRFNSPAELTDDEWKKGFARRLVRQIGRAGTTQEALARKIGISASMMTLYARGKSMPSPYILNKIAWGLKCSVDDLMPKDFVILN